MEDKYYSFSKLVLIMQESNYHAALLLYFYQKQAPCILQEISISKKTNKSHYQN